MENNVELKDYRKQIDRIDREIVALLEERFELSSAIGAYKKERGLPVLDAQREAEKIEALMSETSEGKSEYLAAILKEIMAQSRNCQKELGAESSRGDSQDEDLEYGLLGRTLSHSFSPAIHKMLGGYDYALIEKEPEELADYLRNASFKCINVTIPYKRDVIPFCDRLTDIAAETGSVNMIYRDDEGKLVGDNTDYYGFTCMLRGEGIEVAGRKVLVLGAGGVSGTVRKALADLGAGEVVVISRSGPENYENIGRHSDAQIIINTTPVGMYPNAGKSVIDIDDFPQLEGLADLIYNPLRTKLVQDCDARGVKACGGLVMLAAQATLFNSVPL